MKIAIVGGGLTGLTVAYHLSKKGHKVVIFEKEKKLGGLASSFKKRDWQWPLERYFHHYFVSDKAIKRLVAELGLSTKFFFSQPKTSLFVGGKIFQFDTPGSLLVFPKLSITDKLRTGITTLFLKINPFWQPLEKISALDFIKKTMGEKTLNLIWEPLFVGKFGSLAPKIPASWFWARIKKRSSSLGYFEGGTETLISALGKSIEKNRGQIFLNYEVNCIQKTKTGISLSFTNSQKSQKFDKVLVTVSPATLEKIVPNLSDKEKKQLLSLKSLGSLCLVLALKKSFLEDGTYWLNINEKNFPFVAVIEHTNFIEKKFYGGNTILYVGGYYPADHPFFRHTKQALYLKFLPYLQKINPFFDFNQNFVSSWLFKDNYSQPVVLVDKIQNPLSSSTSVSGLFWACLHHIYPEDRGINYAILLGEKLANEIA